MGHKACSVECSLELLHRNKAKAQRRDTRERLEKLKSRQDWAKEAQAVFNRWIREVRDKDKPCISCGRYANSYDSGHYLSRGAHPELAFEPLNVHKQCSRPCNKDQGGNIVEFRKALLLKIGAENLAWLEGPHPPKRYTIDDLKQIKQTYKEKLKALK